MELNALIEFCKKNSVDYSLNEPMKCHTSFKIGGGADIFISADSAEELAAVLAECKKSGVPHFIIGKGSNLLVSDSGIEGAVISLQNLNSIVVSGERLICGAGASLSEVCRKAAECSLSGLEFAYGIPGSIGGAVFMNAGAYGGEIKDVIVSAECMDKNGNIKTISAEEMCLGYRTSVFKQNGFTVLSATFALKTDEKAAIEEKMTDFINRRKDKQPLEYPSAGSFFKRPAGYFAGALIEKNGLKGFSVGDAQVSVKHAGFVINRGNATADDVKELSRRVRETVLKADGVELLPEVIFIGRE